MPEEADLALVPGRVSEHEFNEQAPLEHSLLVAEHLKRVLAVVLPEAAVPDATKRDAVQAILQADGCFSGSCGNSEQWCWSDTAGVVHYLHDGIVECDAPGRRLVDDPTLQLLVPGEGIDRQRLRLGFQECDAVSDLLDRDDWEQRAEYLLRHDVRVEGRVQQKRGLYGPAQLGTCHQAEAPV